MPADVAATIASLLVTVLADLGLRQPSFDQIMTDEAIRHTDLTKLGLTSLDWIRLAVLIGNETGRPLPEQVLLDAGARTVAAWTQALTNCSDHEIRKSTSCR